MLFAGNSKLICSIFLLNFCSCAKVCQIEDDGKKFKCQSEDWFKFWVENPQNRTSEEIKTLDITNQAKDVHILRRYHLRIFPELEKLRFSNSHLRNLGWLLFTGMHRLKSVSLTDNQISRIPWQAFIGAKDLRINIRGNVLKCECENLWLEKIKVFANMKAFFLKTPCDNGNPRKTDHYNLSISDIFMLPKSIEFDKRSCLESMHCPTPNVRLMQLGPLKADGEGIFQCTLNNQIQTKEQIAVQAFGMLQNKEIVFHTTHRRATGRKANITTFWINKSTKIIHIRIPDLSALDLGLIFCRSWLSDWPEFDTIPIEFHIKPEILPKNNFSELRNESITFYAVGYPLNDMKIHVRKENKTVHPYEFDLQKPKPPLLRLEPTQCRHPELFYRRILVFRPNNPMGHSALNGKYELEICTNLGCSRKNFLFSFLPGLSPPPPPPRPPSEPERPETGKHSAWFLLYSTTLIATLSCFLFVAFLVVWKRRRSDRNLEKFMFAQEAVPLQNNASYLFVNNEDIPCIDKENLKILKELGEGAFGKVYLAQVDLSKTTGSVKTKMEGDRALKVAVKTLKQFSTQHIGEFGREAETMAKLSHPNVVQFFGISVDGADLLLVFEYMNLGDLRSYLHKHGPHAHVLVDNPGNRLDFAELINFCIQLARGLAYLSKMHVVHRDIAARNCLLCDPEFPPRLKLSDFGMSRDIYAADYYRVQKRRVALPVRWLPPESIGFGKFSHESDAWSMGIVWWEIFSYGRLPYNHLSNAEVVEAAKHGIIPEKPEGCPEDVYKLMKQCWKKIPSDRLSVEGADKQLQKISEQYQVTFK